MERRSRTLADYGYFYLQEEHKKLEDTEKRSRDLLSERTEGMLWDLDEIMEQKENPESQKLNMETDELYAAMVQIITEDKDKVDLLQVPSEVQVVY